MTVRRISRFSFITALALFLLLIGSASAASSSSKRIAYVDGGALFTVQPDGGGVTNLGGSGRANPSISTTGSTILFDTGASIESISASGGASTPVCATGTDPAISPSGTSFAYVDGGIRVNTLASGCAASTIASGTDPAWSPDSRQIVLISGGDVHVVAVTGGATANLTTSSSTESDPAWSPDGSRIAYISDGELFVMDADGSNKRLLTSNSLTEANPTWSADSAEIAFARDDDAGAGTDWKLYAIESGGGSVRLIAGGEQPDWGLAVANTSPPAITSPTGTFADGVELSASTGSWDSINPRTYSYRWQRCGTITCTDIPGATAGTYTLTAEDIANSVRVVVIASTSDGSAPGVSDRTPTIAASPPTNTLRPTVSGTFILGGTVTALPGTWLGSNLVFTYQWLRCDAAGANCVAVTTESGVSVYSPVADDVGKRLRVRVRATNGQCPGTPAVCPTADSDASPVVSSNVPTNSTLPAITEVLGTTGTVVSYSATTGIWTGAGTLSFRFQWRRCDSAGENCRDIAGATLSSYTPASADIGARLRVAVTATNAFGSTTAVSEATSVLAGTAPANTIRPSISGTERAGSALFATTGTWTGSVPLTYTYQWQRCNASGTGCTAIASATSSSYVATASDVGATLVVAVTARNSAGSATVSSLPTEVIEAAAPTPTPATRPANTRAPSFTGTLARGRTLTAVLGTWTGTTPLVYSYQWQRCPRTGTACVNIALATRRTYTLVAADVGRRIRLTVTAANAAGSTSATSGISRAVAAKAPARRTARLRRINGNAKANRLVGTARAERIDGKRGNDFINGKGGRDLLLGGPGNDTIFAVDGVADVIDCGPGRDRVTADRVDRVAKSCERVTRRALKKSVAKKV